MPWPKGKSHSEETKAKMRELETGAVLVVSDETGYFGESTAGEIRYAVEHGKPVEFAKPAAGMRAFDAGLIQEAPF